jgi:hypothetical protein
LKSVETKKRQAILMESGPPLATIGHEVAEFPTTDLMYDLADYRRISGKAAKENYLPQRREE